MKLKPRFAREAFLLFPGLLALAAAWEASARIVGTSYLLPFPSDVFLEILTKPGLAESVKITFVESFFGLILGSASGYLLGILFLRYQLLRSSFYPWLLAFRAVPVVAFSYLFVLWFGNGISGKILLGATIAFGPVTVALVEGVAKIPSARTLMFRTYRASGWRRVVTLEIPSTLPDVMGALKFAASLSVIGAIVAEMAGADRGLGYELVRANSSVSAPHQFAVILLSAALALVLYGGVTLLQNVVQPRYLESAR